MDQRALQTLISRMGEAIDTEISEEVHQKYKEQFPAIFDRSKLEKYSQEKVMSALDLVRPLPGR